MGRNGLGRAIANAVAARIGLLLLAGLVAGLTAAACTSELALPNTISA